MDPDQVARYARQIALPEIGPEGQAAICGARVLVVGGDLAAETARTYLTAAGVGAVESRSRRVGDGAAWLDALAGIDLVLRTDFDDDAMLGAAARLGVPVVVTRAEPEQIDLISFPRREPNPEAELDVRARPSDAAEPGAAGILAGTMAAAEALATLVRGDTDPRAEATRHVRLPLTGGDPLTQDIHRP